MTIEKNVTGNHAAIALDGWLDTKTAPALGEAVEELPPEVDEITLDLAKLEYISSAGLRQIVAIHKKMKTFTVKNVSADIMEVFKMIGFDKRLHME